MKKLNKTAAAVFATMMDMMKAKGEDHIKIDNNGPDSGLMAVHIEDLQYDITISGMKARLISIAHYYEQNGDMMRDPDVEFIYVDNRTEDPENLDLVAVYPASFRQDNLNIFRQDINIENGKVTTYKPAPQRDNALFCNEWMKNIKMQQDIKPIKKTPANNGKPQVQTIYDKLNRAAKAIGFKNFAQALGQGKKEELYKQLEKM